MEIYYYIYYDFESIKEALINGRKSLHNVRGS
jgi:hypothetical protein